MKHALIIAALLAGIFTASMFVSSQDDTAVKVVTPAPNYLTDDVYTCLLQQLGITDRNNFVARRPADHMDNTLIYVYAVTNIQRDETRAVTIEYGFDATGSSVVVNCWPSNEWQRWPGVPTVTPYLLPAEIENGGTPVS